MVGKQREDVRAEDVTGLKYFDKLAPLLERLKEVGCRLGSLSEATDVFEPERSRDIIAELGRQLEPVAHDPRLKDVQHTLTLVDGTLLKGLPVLVQAAMADPPTATPQAKCRLHTQFDLERGVPIRIDIPAGISRGYAKFQLFNQIVAARKLNCNEVLARIAPVGRRCEKTFA